ncbi:MAG: hypothetical protein A2W19_01915 [Spirochaetes bacterium RBG_16_49_21]|nr:MAG: hypothetical protein A2W19_01915 [Spirochaetes bacterium RBG_16_49_21]
MIVYRLSKEKYSGDLSGKGSEITGGRWNAAGIPALYAAQNISLAVLESIVHAGHINNLYNQIIVFLAIDESVHIHDISANDLPPKWNAFPWVKETVNLGTKWLLAKEHPVISLPSAIVPQERIYIINPLHADMAKIRIRHKESFVPDSRLELKKSS